MDLAAKARNKLHLFLEMIKFEHTVFALPFAYLGLWLGERGWPRFHVFGWVTVAMVGLRTAAMSWNRVVDRKIDALNPRTAGWAIPRGLLSVSTVWSAAVAATLVYFAAAWNLNRLAFYLSPVPLTMVVIYPYLKRFTWFCHFFLGMILGIAPAAGWVASRGSVSMECWLLFAAVILWVAGFDMIYALQDVAFDRSQGLWSFPAVFDKTATLWITRLLHAGTVGFLILLARAAGLGAVYWGGLAVITAFLVREHWLISRSGLKKIQEAFFQMNALVSLVLFFATCADLAMGGGR